MENARIYVCDDELLIRMWLVEHLQDQGYEAEGFETGTELLEAFARDPADLVLLDLKLPDGSGLDFLVELKERERSVLVIMITAYGEVETAVAAVRAGAHHFLEKPVDLPELFLLVEQALEAQRLLGELERYREGNRWQFSGVTLVGRSAAIRKAAELITRIGVKGSAATVLIRGESGTGKDVVARAIHARGRWRNDLSRRNRRHAEARASEAARIPGNPPLPPGGRRAGHRGGRPRGDGDEPQAR
jgi:two-component system response regulator HydG